MPFQKRDLVARGSHGAPAPQPVVLRHEGPARRRCPGQVAAGAFRARNISAFLHQQSVRYQAEIRASSQARDDAGKGNRHRKKWFLTATACIVASFLTTGCQTARTFATPDATWTSHIGQLKHTNSKRVLVGEVVVQQRGAQEFQLDYLKGGSFPLLSLRQDAAGARAEGLLANGHWQGTPATAPKPLRPWLNLREVFAQKYPPGSKAARVSPSLTYSGDGQNFEFLFNR